MKSAITLALFVVAAPIPLPAQQVVKCVEAGGRTTYQSPPCQAGAKTARSWDAVPDAPATSARIDADRKIAATSAALRRQRLQEQRVAARHSSGSRTGSKAAEPDGCTAARMQRDAKLKAVGLARTFDLLSQLDEAVNQACRR